VSSSAGVSSFEGCLIKKRSPKRASARGQVLVKLETQDESNHPRGLNITAV
jgi:hypothetical protein